jgi:hypothetical protein
MFNIRQTDTAATNNEINGNGTNLLTNDVNYGSGNQVFTILMNGVKPVFLYRGVVYTPDVAVSSITTGRTYRFGFGNTGVIGSVTIENIKFYTSFFNPTPVLAPIQTSTDITVITISNFDTSNHDSATSEAKYTIQSGFKLAAGGLVTGNKVLIGTPGTGFPLYNVIFCSSERNDPVNNDQYAKFRNTNFVTYGYIRSLPAGAPFLVVLPLVKNNCAITYTYNASSAANDPLLAKNNAIVFRENVVDNGTGQDLIANTVYFVCGLQTDSNPMTLTPNFANLVGGKRTTLFYVKPDREREDLVI